MKLGKLIIVAAIVIVAVAAYGKFKGEESGKQTAIENKPTPKKPAADAPRMEEKYGFTTEGVGL